MKLVVSSDWHHDHVTRGVERAEEIEAAVFESVKEAVCSKPDAYVFLGDLCDPTSGAATIRAVAFAMRVAQHLASHDVRSIWVAGNHDVCNDGRGITTLTPLRALGLLVHVLEAPGSVRMAELPPVHALPFTEPARGYDAGKTVTQLQADDRPSVVLGHLSVPGIVPGEETLEMPRGREVVFPLAETRGALLRMNGHYHRRQSFDPGDGGPPVEVPGSLAALTFGEERNKVGYLVVEIG